MKSTTTLPAFALLLWLVSPVPAFCADATTPADAAPANTTATPATPAASKLVTPSKQLSTFISQNLDKLLAPLSTDFTAKVAFNIDLIKVPANVRGQVEKLSELFAQQTSDAPAAAQAVFGNAKAVCDRLTEIMDQRDQYLVALAGSRDGSTMAVVNPRPRRNQQSVTAVSTSDGDSSTEETAWLKKVPDYRSTLDYQMGQLRASEHQFKAANPSLVSSIESPPLAGSSAAAAAAGPADVKAKAQEVFDAVKSIQTSNAGFMSSHASASTANGKAENAAQTITGASGNPTTAQIQALSDALAEARANAEGISKRPAGRGKNQETGPNKSKAAQLAVQYQKIKLNFDQK
jgi:hypothetical protein